MGDVMKNDLVSIIVPVYNVEKYISKCLESLVHQTYGNLEIIVVNDGSIDNSEKVIRDFMKQDKRIYYYKKKNGGLSSARNFGLNKATGEYVLFVDSDDYIRLNTIQILIDNIKNYDIICFNYVVVFENEQHDYIPKYYLRESALSNYILTQPSACTKMYKRDLFLANNLLFDEGIHYEDLALIPSLACLTDRIIFINHCLYYYVIRKDSIMHHKKFSNKIDDKFIALNLLKERLNQKFEEEYHFLVIKHLCIVYVSEIIGYGKKIYGPRLKNVREYLKQNNIKVFQNKYFKLESLKNKIFIFSLLHNIIPFIKIMLYIKNKKKGDFA